MNSTVAITLLTSCTILATASLSAAEQEQPPDPVTFSGKANLATDYVFRGISQTNEEPQVQVEFTATHVSGLYAGVWSSNTDFGGPGNSMEFDPYVGFSADLGDTGWSYDVGYWHYHYPGAESDFDYGEFYGIVHYTVGKLTASASLWYASDYFGDDFFGDGSSLAYQGGLAYELPRGFSVSGTLGQQTFDEPSGLSDQDYVYYNIGVSNTWRGFTFDLRWHDTNDVKPDLAASNLADGRLVAKITKGF